MYRYIPAQEDQEKMLSVIGVNSVRNCFPISETSG